MDNQHTSLVKGAEQHLHFLHRIRRADLPPPPALTTFYRVATGRILTNSPSVWCSSCHVADPTKGDEDSKEDHQMSPTIHSRQPSISSKTPPTQHTNYSPSYHLPTLPRHAVPGYQTQRQLFPTGLQPTPLSQEKSITMITSTPTKTNQLLK